MRSDDKDLRTLIEENDKWTVHVVFSERPDEHYEHYYSPYGMYDMADVSSEDYASCVFPEEWCHVVIDEWDCKVLDCHYDRLGRMHILALHVEDPRAHDDAIWERDEMGRLLYY